MKDKRSEFLEWYQTQKDVVYNFQKELREYCIDDVRILKEAMEIYQTNGKEFNEGLDPLACTTIASYCMKVYRTLHLPDSETIGVLTKEEHDFVRRGFFGGEQTLSSYTTRCLKKTSTRDGTYDTRIYKASIRPPSTTMICLLGHPPGMS